MKLSGRKRLSSASAQTVQRLSSAGERVRFHAELLQHRNKEIAQRGIVIGIEAQMLPVTKTASREQHRQVFGVVTGSVSEIASEQDHCPIEQRAVVLGRLL